MAETHTCSNADPLGSSQEVHKAARAGMRRLFASVRRPRPGSRHHGWERTGPNPSFPRVRSASSLSASAASTNHLHASPLDHESSRTDHTEPWKTLLEMPARAAWRVSPPRLPEALDHAQRRLLQRTKGYHNQTRQHLKDVHGTIVQSHKELALRRHRERLRTLNAQSITPAEQRRDARVTPVPYGPDETLAALTFRLYPNFSIVRRVLQETKSLLAQATPAGQDAPNQPWRPRSVLDMGMGCGSATAAVLDVWDHQTEWIHGIDPSETMRDAARAMLETYSQQQQQQDSESNPVVPRITLSAHLSAEMAPPSFDLALFAYTATELPHGSSILAAAAILWEKLVPGGLFVMVEPGTPDGFSSIRMVRNMLLDCVPEGEETCTILAPCTHQGSCPMEQYMLRSKDSTQIDVTQAEEQPRLEQEGQNDALSTKGFCSFVQTIPTSTKGEKFSYLVVQKRVGHGDPAKTITPFDDLTHSLRLGLNGSSEEAILATRRAAQMEANYLDSDDELGLEVLRGDDNRSAFGRIVRSPLKRKGHVHIDCCVGPGRIERLVVSKSASRKAPGVYAAARKARWGGFWPTALATSKR